MENKLKIFKNEKFGEIRTVTIGDEPWFCLVDICRILNLENTSQVKSRLKADGVISNEVIDSLGRKQEASFITESNLYKTIFHSKTDFASNFQDWITEEVIPKIRKHGMYATDNFVDMALSNPEHMIQILKAYEIEKKAKKGIKLKLEEKTIQLDENKKWFSIKRMAALNNKNWRYFDWKRLKKTSDYLEIEVKKVFDANYVNGVNVYHQDVWKHEYPGLKFQ
jgi:prophage antirepressor-like protein